VKENVLLALYQDKHCHTVPVGAGLAETGRLHGRPPDKVVALSDYEHLVELLGF
jgi:hypothetical protein